MPPNGRFRGLADTAGDGVILAGIAGQERFDFGPQPRRDIAAGKDTFTLRGRQVGDFAEQKRHLLLYPFVSREADRRHHYKINPRCFRRQGPRTEGGLS
jgi:hypothetical protein